jgi:hypothetical protein
MALIIDDGPAGADLLARLGEPPTYPRAADDRSGTAPDA